LHPSTNYWSDEQAAALIRLLLGQTRQYGVVFYDDALRITGWNEGGSFITGWSAAELLGRPTGLLFVPEDRERKLDEHEANTVRVVGVAEDERWHLRKDGSRFWSSGVSMALRREDGAPAGFVKVFRDATHLRARMKYLENMLQECSVRQQENDVFIGTIAHEMRNPLSPLKTAVELLKRLPGDNPRQARPIQIMERQIGFLERLVEDLVDLARVQSGKMSMVYETVVLQDFLRDVLDSCRPAAEAKRLTVQDVMPPVAIEVEADPRRLQQVMLNLLNNAIKYTPEGGNIWLTATVDQTHFFCYVKDDGQGIGADLLPRIFNVFTQADGRHAARGAGLGIGLAVVKEIVALHQGTVEVRSEGPGRGSEFTVRMPQRRPHGSEPEPLPPPDRQPE
jgi:two-component system CheB/CheR fusion protein